MGEDEPCKISQEVDALLGSSYDLREYKRAQSDYGSLYFPSANSTPDLRGTFKKKKKPSLLSRLRHRFSDYESWLPRHRVSRVVTLCALGLLAWGITLCILGPHTAGPQGPLFRLGLLCVTAEVFGWIIEASIGLPPLLGMLLAGVLLRNIEFVSVSGNYLDLAAVLRKAALTIILIRAGLGLDAGALQRLSGVVLRLACIPSIVEASAVAIMTHFLLDLPWIWSFLLGSVMAAVSPAVVIPCLFSLQERGYGVQKGIPTLVIAAASVDDIISISLFGILLSIIYSSGNLTAQILKGPLGLIFGSSAGILWGFLLYYVPEKNDKHVVLLRTILLAAGGMLLLQGSETVGYDGAGPLGCVVAAFVARQGWRSQGWDEEKDPVSENFASLWAIFQPILFGLIGTEVNLFELDLEMVGLGAMTLATCLTIRIICTMLMAFGGNFNWKEKFFVSLAWFPKATVQAAVGPVALDLARSRDWKVEEEYSQNVLMMAVLAILLTAPLGACIIALLGPRLLSREEREQQELKQDEVVYTAVY